MHAARTLPPTPKQVDYARHIAARLGARIPADLISDRAALSGWIGEHQARLNATTHRITDGRATSRQVAFAERIARAKRRAIPDECFRDAGMMSAWISSNR
ncbi:hypothetical protein [Aliiroseovarius sp. F47248L]|uniref:hypothetical protein n=1 Tax=Aliiroseovarius sp. F47248L TaxID=2926420 RepID=UPI001FF539BF|nr:hypothetical protein [Aliiroseovarius sp. F47248L]MCK0139211.1 hypothetical protein [Aliiroseovarius sp. F47248L]